MKKQDFIRELTSALASIDAQSRAEIIADINEHFAEGAAHGQTEEEICKNLGQPGQIAEQVLEEYNAYKTNNNTEYTSGIDDIVSSAMEAIENIDIGGIVSSALKSAAEATRAASDVFSHTHSENTPPTVQWQSNTSNMDIPWSADTTTETEGTTRIRGGYEIDISKVFTGVTGINISLSVCNVKLMSNPQSNDVSVVIQGKSRYNVFQLENKNGTLIIRQREPFVKFQLFGFRSTLEATIYLPASFTGDIKATASIGNISATGIRGNLRLLTSAGKIAVDGHVAGKVNLHSSAGNISLTGSLVHDVIAKSSAGSVKVESQEASGLVLGSSAGNIDVRVGKLSGDANLSTSAGYVKLSAQDVQGNITAKSSAGSVHMYLPQDVNCRINVKKPSMGSVSNYLTGNPHSPYILHASTSIGSVTLEPLARHQN